MHAEIHKKLKNFVPLMLKAQNARRKPRNLVNLICIIYIKLIFLFSFIIYNVYKDVYNSIYNIYKVVYN